MRTGKHARDVNLLEKVSFMLALYNRVKHIVIFYKNLESIKNIKLSFFLSVFD